MNSLFGSLVLIELGLGVSLLFESIRSGSDPSMDDTVVMSKDAEAAGALYKRAAAAMPTEEESARAIFLANAESIGSIDEERCSRCVSDWPSDVLAACERRSHQSYRQEQQQNRAIALNARGNIPAHVRISGARYHPACA